MKSALSAWYFAAGRLGSRPCTTTAPSLVQMLQVHFLLRCTKITSNIENAGLTIAAASRQTSNLDRLEPGGPTYVFTHLGEEELA
jgi:hypothetical protein